MSYEQALKVSKTEHTKFVVVLECVLRASPRACRFLGTRKQRRVLPRRKLGEQDRVRWAAHCADLGDTGDVDDGGRMMHDGPDEA